jgi:hypothetical protein
VTFGLGNRCSIRLSYGTVLVLLHVFRGARNLSLFCLSCARQRRGLSPTSEQSLALAKHAETWEWNEVDS